MKKITFHVIIAAAAWIGCATPQQPEVSAPPAFVCREHGAHTIENRASFHECMKIPSGAEQDYFFYEESSLRPVSAGMLEATAKELRGEIEDKIVAFVMGKITRAMEKQLFKHWDYDSMRIPATIRTFVKEEKGLFSVKVFAAMKKSDFTPRGIIMYLPLEYKMHLLEKNKDQ